MKKGLLLAVVLGMVLLLSQLSGQALASFQESRWQIMDLLAYPEKIEEGFEAYRVSKASWERSDLADGTPRWLAQSAKLYNYELIGTPIKSATMTGGITNDTNQVYRLMIRAALLMRAVGMSKDKAAEVFETLVNSATKDKDQKYYLDAEGIRTELTVFSSLAILILTVSKA